MPPPETGGVPGNESLNHAARSSWLRRWAGKLWRFRLRSLFLFVAVMAMCFAWWGDHRAQDREIDRLKGKLRQADLLAQALQMSGTKTYDEISKALVENSNRLFRVQRADEESGAEFHLEMWSLHPPAFAGEEKNAVRWAKQDGTSATELVSRDEAIARLEKLLQHSDKIKRAGAAQSLGYLFANESLAPLLNALADKEPLVRRCAAFALGEFLAPEAKDAIPLLQAEMIDPKSPNAAFAAQILRKIDPAANVVPRLRELLSHEDANMRGLAAVELGRINSPAAAAAAPQIVELLQDADERVRIVAATALSKLGPPERAIVVLVGAFEQEKNDKVRLHLAKVLSDLQAKKGP
jgi:hypothetical protein